METHSNMSMIKQEKIWFIALGETSEQISFICPDCYYLHDSLYVVTDDLHIVIDEYNNISLEKKEWKIHIEAFNLIAQELEDVKHVAEEYQKISKS